MERPRWWTWAVRRVSHITHIKALLSQITLMKTKDGLLGINFEAVTRLCNYTAIIWNMLYVVCGWGGSLKLKLRFLIGKCIFEPWCWALQRSKKSWVTVVGHGHYKVLITRALACILGSEYLAGRFPSNLKNSRYN